MRKSTAEGGRGEPVDMESEGPAPQSAAAKAFFRYLRQLGPEGRRDPLTPPDGAHLPGVSGVPLSANGPTGPPPSPVAPHRSV